MPNRHSLSLITIARVAFAGLLAAGALMLIASVPATANASGGKTHSSAAKAKAAKKKRKAKAARAKACAAAKKSTSSAASTRAKQCLKRRPPRRPKPSTPATPTTPAPPATPPTTPTAPTTPAPPIDTTPGSAQGWNGFGPKNWPGANWRPYSADSPFNQPVGNAAVHPRSAQMVQKVMSWGQPGNLIAGSSGTTKDFAHPTYYSQPGDPIFTLHATGTRNYLEGMKIAIPDAAQPALGDDGHMTVITTDGWEYDFWRVSSKPKGGGTLTFSIGGRTRIDGKGIDSKATAANFGNLAGVIRAQELAAGQINHALFIVLRCVSSGTSFGAGTVQGPSSTQGSWVYPASHGATPCSAAEQADAPPTGARFQLAMSDAEINALSVPNWKKTILRALATYGGYVGDTGGAGFSLQFESGATYTSFGVDDPLVSYSKSAGIREGTGSWAGTFSYQLAGGVDWQSRLQVVAPPAA